MREMGSILVRYAEMGLKSRSVRKRFESILVDNLMSSLANAGLEGLIATEYGRIFVEVEDPVRASSVLSRVFGVSSVSSVIRCPGEMEEMKRKIADFSKPLLKEGQSFAVRARRTGDHPFTSMDLGRELGSAVFLANEEKGVRVDLTDPDVEVFAEVRERKAYLFSAYIPGPGGLPLGSQGKVVVLLEQERDALAAWIIMKRGCRAIALGQDDSAAAKLLRAWDPTLKVSSAMDLAEALKRHKALAAVFGYTLEDFEKIKEVNLPVPAFFPLVGMDSKEIEERLERIRA
jgi:thiamine biosynthesis protein ThiI